MAGPAARLPARLAAAVEEAGLSGGWIGAPQAASLDPAKGAYALALRLDRLATLGLPRRAPARRAPGWYLYLGSARGPGGLGARLARHFRWAKPCHWHIDRLTARAARVAALAVEDGEECALTARLLASGEFEAPVPGFGSSDCRRCKSHLLAFAPPQRTHAPRGTERIC